MTECYAYANILINIPAHSYRHFSPLFCNLTSLKYFHFS